ncbi:hypothetical protein KBB17_03910 [Candidatus Saccharibacteria bacterium]|nr:hypothetical protein [Candidatus Saccharibacteria bacterium]
MAERGKGFPKLSLYSAVKVVDAASKFGKSWPKEQFAGFGSQSGAGSAKSGAFANRISSLRDYGLITTTKDTVSLTELGIQIAKPVTDQEREDAIKQAFLNVNSFKGLLDGLDHDVELSLDQVAQYAVFNLNISRESKNKFLSSLIESGKFVNLLTHSKESQTITLLDIPQDKDFANSAESEELATDVLVAQANVEPGIVSSPALMTTSQRPLSTLSTEQGVNHAGEGWTLTVLLKSSLRLDTDTRKKVRDLLEAADEISDLLHALEEKA